MAGEDSAPPAGPSAKRGGGLRAVAAPIGRIVGPALSKRGLAQGRLLTDWTEIVGPELARHSRPEKLVTVRGDQGGGTLELCVDGTWALEIQHLAPVLIERINRYFGYGAVARLRLVQGPLARPAAPPPAAPAPSPEAESRLQSELAGIADPELREALAGLGRALLAPAKSPSEGPARG